MSELTKIPGPRMVECPHCRAKWKKAMDSKFFSYTQLKQFVDPYHEPCPLCHDEGEIGVKIAVKYELKGGLSLLCWQSNSSN